jgi:hypothetical protein
MEKTTIDNLFNNLKNDFDIEKPNQNHKQRFLDKLNKNGELQLVKVDKRRRRLRKPLIGVAASIVLLITVFIGTQQEPNTRDLASISPQMAETQDFFTITIEEELSNLQKESSPEVKILVDDALKRMKILEENYEALKTDLSESGDDNRVIYAMISNFQNRIDILKNTIEQINNIKQIKNQSNETSTTI